MTPAFEDRSPFQSPRSQRVILIGFMGSGKSTVGRLLAAALGWDFLDTDAVIESRAGETVPVIFRTRGEPAFRDLEAEVLESLRARTGVVIAAGGGAPVQARNAGFFSAAGTAVFYLRVSLPGALRRTGASRDRPLLAQGEAAVRKLYESRLPLYESLGTAVETEERDPASVAADIRDLLQTQKT